ncbi:hypothetical protein ACF0H5_016411 [Mactra antiquata]
MIKLLGRIRRNMKFIKVYLGVGAYDKDSDILVRVLKKYTDDKLYKVDYITPEEIIDGKLCSDTSLLAIGGGYDLGLIQSLGEVGMTNIKNYVHSGGSYLGICSGAYFACDRIEFDKDGPLEVVGDRFLKFYPGCGTGPLFKPYDYTCRKGASAADIDFIEYKPLNIISNDDNTKGDKFECKSYFNGGCYFTECDEIKSNNNVVILSRYLNLNNTPASIVYSKVGKGHAVLSGPHIEYDSIDIDDGDQDVIDIIPHLKHSITQRKQMMSSILKNLNIKVLED